jgi:hypothetical protein
MQYLQTGIGIIGLASLSVVLMHRNCGPIREADAASVNSLKAASMTTKVRPTDYNKYRSWTTTTRTPILLDPLTSKLCSASIHIQMPGPPHDSFFMTCYVNCIGRTAMLYQLKPVFPVGTIIIKEKLNSDIAKFNVRPALLTGMVKRAKGYNQQHGDWEYFVTTSDVSKIVSSGKLANCIRCHDQKHATDYVFRDASYPTTFPSNSVGIDKYVPYSHQGEY